ncbi:MAG: DNA primase, partial [Verrucomicrobia bacterium]|nr:DNA primase [Verrucomicrobiota bacterium]
MAGWIPEEKLEEIRAASDIVEVVQRYVPLRRRGAGYVALCPFHEEKTPSFHVNPVRQIFHCFGCHKGGDVFRFVQEYERVSFVEAVARLAERAGIPLEWEGDVQAVRQAQTLKERMRRAHADLAQHWHRLLLRDAAAAGAREYLRRRGLVEAVVKRFQIGYAPPGWEETLRWGAARGYDPEFLEQAGLAKRRASGEGSYSFFRNRLVFPICDEQGRVVGFSARALAPEDEERKYINTPETPIFQKGK